MKLITIINTWKIVVFLGILLMALPFYFLIFFSLEINNPFSTIQYGFTMFITGIIFKACKKDVEKDLGGQK